MKILFFLLLTLTFSFIMNAQVCNYSDEELIKYIIEQENLKEYTIEELKDYFFKIELNTSEIEIKEIGVYKFGLTITHTKRYLLLKDRVTCEFVDFKTIEDGIIDMCKFFKRNIDTFSSHEIIDYIEKSIKMFKSNQRSQYLRLEDN